MLYPVVRRPDYDFVGQSYADRYPNLRRYPATMLPQIGIQILREFGLTGASLLDPYCGFDMMYGFDMNPLAVLITNAKLY